MSIRLPPINALIAFEAVARHASFSKAAEELCLTHGAVSHRIKLLEDHLNTLLIDRGARQVSLTHAGRIYLSHVSHALKLLQTAESEVRVTPARRQLKINILPGLAGSWLISRLADFRSKHPDIDIEIDPLTYPLEQFETQRVDVAIRYCAGDFPSFRNLKLLEVRLFPICSPDYECRTALETPADLVRENLLVHQADPWEIWFHEQGLDDISIEPTSVFGDSRLLVDAAMQGDGIALARDVIAAPKIAQGALRRPFDTEVVSPKSYFALTKPSARQPEQTALFLQWVEGQALAWRSAYA